MNLIDKMERRFGRYAISNLSLILIICYGFGYAISLVNNSFLGYLTLNPYLILRGQVWRLITWILIPPGRFSMFTIISLYFYYWIGSTLERTWGTFKYNLFIFLGYFFTVIGAFVCLAYYYMSYGSIISGAGADSFFGPGGVVLSTMGVLPPIYAFYSFSTYYVNLSIFMAFALTYPDVRVFLFFIIPIKVKWLGILDVALTIYTFIGAQTPERIVIAASLLNVIIFFLATRNMMHMSPKQVKRRMVYRAQVRRPTAGGVTRHKCAICGQTEESDPSLDFRFCSKCNGNYEYCNNHLFTHTHVK